MGEKEEEFEESAPIEMKPLHPLAIFEGNWEENIPNGFDAITISLDGSVRADLNWKNGSDEAEKAIEKGYKVMWDLRLALFDGLTQSLSNQTQFLSLCLSLEHFYESVWKKFESHSLGVSLYRGHADFSQRFRWDEQQQQNFKEWMEKFDHFQIDFLSFKKRPEEQRFLSLFCRNVSLEYLTLLASRLPDTVTSYLFLDGEFLSPSMAKKMQLLNPESFDRFQLALKENHLPFEALGWHMATPSGYSGSTFLDIPKPLSQSIGICLPPATVYDLYPYQQLEKGIKLLQQKSIPFKFIPENFLTTMWEGLDDIFFAPSGLSVQGKRKLLGFCAAGGNVVSMEEPFGFPHEMSLPEWIDSK